MSKHDSLEHILSELRLKGMRITEPRKAILKYLIQSEKHPSAEEIYNALKDELDGVSLATVYNNLNFFVDEGIVYEMKFSHVSSRYDFMGHSHYHIICKICGKIADFHDSSLEEVYQSAIEQTGYEVHNSKLELYGLCPECQLLKDNTK